MSLRHVLVLDLETQKSFKEVSASRDQMLEKLKISVVGVYDYADDQYRIYEEKELMVLEKHLREASLVIGFNIRRFDMPVLAPYLFSPVSEFPVLDLLEDIEKVRGHRVSLDSIARPTLNQQKSGSGKDAITLFRENRMEELKRYCLDDVRLTKGIYDYGCQHGKIYFISSRDYQTYEVPVSWKQSAEVMIQKKAERQATFPASLF